MNDDIADLARRNELRFFDQNEGLTITLHTGEVGDEGWFAPKVISDSWAAAGPTNDGLGNFLGLPSTSFPHGVGPGLGTSNDPEVLLDEIPDVTPLRATGLSQLIGPGQARSGLTEHRFSEARPGTRAILPILAREAIQGCARSWSPSPSQPRFRVPPL
ncbi:MAG: hypothetical protein GY725_19180 [bacterium]|nr:hypothetical protein [bacterium]